MRFAERKRRACFAATTLVVAASFVPSAAESQALCRITSADAFVFSDTTRGDLVTYYAQAIMYTEHCGLSPAEVQATFRPVAGSPSTCDFRGTLLSDYALCRGAEGVAAAGTPVVVEAVGRTYGSGGADLFRSSCALVVMSLPPSGDVGSSAIRASCPLPVD